MQGLRNEITEIRSEIRSVSSRTLTLESSNRAHNDAISKLKEEVKDISSSKSVDNSRLGPLSNKILVLENAERRNNIIAWNLKCSSKEKIMIKLMNCC